MSGLRFHDFMDPEIKRVGIVSLLKKENIVNSIDET